MHTLFHPIELSKPFWRKVFASLNCRHEFTEDVKVFLFRSEPQMILQEKWNNDFPKIRALRHLIAITLLVIFSSVLLEINISASEVFLKLKENVLIFFYQLNVEFRLDSYASLLLARVVESSYISSKTAFSINKTNNVVRIEHTFREDPSPFNGYYDPADS